MNNPLNSIMAFAAQASAGTRRATRYGIGVAKNLIDNQSVRGAARAAVTAGSRAVSDGVVAGNILRKDSGLMRQVAIHAGIGAGVGAAGGAGVSAATGDRRMGRDASIGAVAGALGGAGWAGRRAGPAAWNSVRPLSARQPLRLGSGS